MSFWGIVIFALLLFVALVAMIADLRSDHGAYEQTTSDYVLWKVLGFFGIGNVPPMLALAVLTSTAAISSVTLDTLAFLALGDRYPSWFPADAAATGLGVGLLCTWLLSSGKPRHD